MKFLFNKLFHFPVFWYKDFLIGSRRFFRNLIIFLDNKLAVSLMLKMLFVPLFHDTSIVGRVLSFIFRFSRVILGSLIISLVILAMFFWLIVWIFLPVMAVIIFGEIGILGFGILWTIDFIYKVLSSDKRFEPSRALKKYLKEAKNNSQVLKTLILKDKEVIDTLEKLEISGKAFLNLENILIISDWKKLALDEAHKINNDYLGSMHFLLALLKHNDWRYKEAITTIQWLNKKKFWKKTLFLWDKEFITRPMGGINRAWTGVPTPTLDKYSIDLTKQASKAQLPEIIGKKEIIGKIIDILGRKRMNNALIIGEPGSGKTTLIKGIAQEIVRGIKSKDLRFKRLVQLEASRLAASANGAELNYRITKIIDEIKRAENIILFVDEIHYLSSINKEMAETSNLFMALEPPLSEGKFQFIGTTSSENYKKYIEPNEAFSRLFDVIKLKSADKKQTMLILQYIAFREEESEKVKVTMMALLRIIELADKLIHNREFPDKAVNLLDEVVVQLKSKDKKLVTSNMVEKLVSKKTNVPVTKLSLKDKELLLNLETKMHQRVVGQDKAIKAVANAIRRARTNLKNPNKPIASFMFAGPTGVGKTETAKTLANEFFGSEKTMIRLDMSEYQTLDSISRLIGASPANRVVSEGGQLTEAVRHQPYTLILLDEIEKAHKNVINLFLQVLDEARLTDSDGHVIDFSNTIIIATTNVGTREILDDKNGMKAIESHYSPEFLNRFSGLIVFNSLTKDETEKIIRLKLTKLVAILKNQEIEVKFGEKVIKTLANLAFSKKWGGRQADRVIQEKIMNGIASKILKGEIKKKQLFLMHELS
ncbi:MAG: ATP-dependent Clp protease ATP-binding subunit [Patescibacteria group bacterium]|nr:ATP-dependent Clp protease ATP-binding subunit [Patescibacteria group bacterium]